MGLCFYMGKKLWDVIKPGRPPAFKTPDEMWKKAVEYFKWCDENFISEGKSFCFQGEIVRGEVPHMRAMTAQGLSAFLNISVSSWYAYKQKEEFLDITSLIDQVMYEQKFSGAASGQLNANIIARDLGLSDKTEIIGGGEVVTPWSQVKAGVAEKDGDA